MGRPPKRSATPYPVVEERLQKASQLAAPDFMPQHPELLGLIIIALTTRIGTLSPDEYAIWRLIDVPVPPNPDRLKLIVLTMLGRIHAIHNDEHNHCRSRIAEIAAIEAANVEDLSPKEKAHEIQKVLEALAYGPASKCVHAPQNVTIQREILIDYLISEKYIKPVNRRAWLHERWERIIELLTRVPCRCCYDSSYDQFARQIELYKPRTVAETADAILSGLHNSTPEEIRKLARTPA